MFFKAGMRVRLTRNVEQQHSFVNDTLDVVEHVLAHNVFVLKTQQGNRGLVHPVSFAGATFMPTCYGYALTIR